MYGYQYIYTRVEYTKQRQTKLSVIGEHFWDFCVSSSSCLLYSKRFSRVESLSVLFISVHLCLIFLRPIRRWRSVMQVSFLYRRIYSRARLIQISRILSDNNIQCVVSNGQWETSDSSIGSREKWSTRNAVHFGFEIVEVSFSLRLLLSSHFFFLFLFPLSLVRQLQCAR